ncbi:hypothetical protein CPB86DRAFT_870483 [Serendipita vermifera]|nr:hypothetical protein CPB86DRAFT_870483 [Serendipita vermifera]
MMKASLMAIYLLQPVIDGVKMACAACIRGHRSTSCQHTDRPLLEVRKKGRPMSQCEHCRDLRKVKQVHVRCNCRPDESEAPKRATKGKSAKVTPSEPHPPCDCDNTGVCTCAIPRVTSSRNPNPRRQSGQTASTADKPSKTARRESLSGSSSESSLLHPLSDSGSSMYGSTAGYSTDQGSSTSNCCSKPASTSAASTASVIPPAPSVPEGLTHFNPPYQPDNLNSILPPDPFWYDMVGTQQPLRSNRYTPYPQPNYSTSSALANKPVPTAQPPVSDPIYDPKTVALWEEFLRDDDPPSTQPSTSTVQITNPEPQPLTIPIPQKHHTNCICTNGATCSACSPDSVASFPSIATPTCESVAVANAFNCDAMMSAILALKEELPITGDVCPLAAMAIAATQQATKTAPTSVSTSDLFPELSGSYQLSQPVASLSPPQLAPLPSSNPAITGCTCGPDCTCFACSGNNGTDLTLPGKDACKSCSSCLSCSAFNQTLAEIPPTPSLILNEPFIY